VSAIAAGNRGLEAIEYLQGQGYSVTEERGGIPTDSVTSAMASTATTFSGMLVRHQSSAFFKVQEPASLPSANICVRASALAGLFDGSLARHIRMILSSHSGTGSSPRSEGGIGALRTCANMVAVAAFSSKTRRPVLNQ